jgi:hypothetical protein
MSSTWSTSFAVCLAHENAPMMVEVGRVDIITEISKMASQMAAPQEGHLDALLHMLGFV